MGRPQQYILDKLELKKSSWSRDAAQVQLWRIQDVALVFIHALVMMTNHENKKNSLFTTTI